MTLPLTEIHSRLVATLLVSAVLLGGCVDSHDSQRTAERLATASSSHPFAGFWKEPGCVDNFGLAIAPAEAGTYSVSFCGPGGCFKPGTYRPNTSLVGDSNYRILDKDTIEVLGRDGFSKYVRCGER
jgi:hypothetical protein